MTESSVAVIGVEMYCEYCRRKLVSFNENGTFNLAGLAGVTTLTEVEQDEGGWPVELEATVIEATCYRMRCRMRRFADKHGLPRR